MQNVEHWPFGFPELKMRELNRVKSIFESSSSPFRLPFVILLGVYPPFHCVTTERAAGEGWVALAFRFTRDM